MSEGESCTTPLVSIVVVTYERRDAVAAALASIRSNAGPDCEILIVDNGSRGGGVPDSSVADLSNVSIIRLPENVGCPAARNRAYERCRGEYIINVDDDGLLGPHVIPQTVAMFAAEPDIGIIGFRQVTTMGDAQRRPRESQGIETSVFSGGLCAIRGTMLRVAGGYPEGHFLFAEEEHLALRALEKGFRIVRRDDVYMVHPPAGGSSSRNLDRLRFRNALANVIELFPTALVLPAFGLRACSLLRAAVRRRTLPAWGAALREVLRAWPAHWRQRRACRARTVWRYFSLRK